MKKIAIFVDWENLRLEIQHFQKNHKLRGQVQFNYNNVDNITSLINKAVEEGEEIYRIFFYTAEPLSLEEECKKHQHFQKNLQDFKNNNAIKYNKMENLRGTILKFLQEISFQNYFALRLGELKLHGFADNKPIIQQKQVDMLLGLDISHIAYQKLADKIVIFCKDTDIIPALKCARINGLTVSLAHIKEGYKIPNRLKKHTDLIKEISLIEEYPTSNS